jgi:hypothetical protein
MPARAGARVAVQLAEFGGEDGGDGANELRCMGHSPGLNSFKSQASTLFLCVRGTTE